MSETRAGAQDSTGQTRSSLKPRASKARRVVAEVDAFSKTLPNSVSGLREMLRWFLSQVRENYSPSIRGGSGKFTRWDHHGAQVEASVREVGGKILMDAPVEVGASLNLISVLDSEPPDSSLVDGSLVFYLNDVEGVDQVRMKVKMTDGTVRFSVPITIK